MSVMHLTRAHSKGNVYLDRDTWKCTTHGHPLTKTEAGHLEARCCGMEVLTS